MAITDNVSKVRLEIGDTDSTTYLLTDEEINYFLSEAGDSVLGAAWRACEALSRRFARAYDFETDGQKFSRSQMSKAYAQMAETLRGRTGGIGTVHTTKVDGYSDDIRSDEILTTQTNPRRRYYGQEDRIP